MKHLIFKSLVFIAILLLTIVFLLECSSFIVKRRGFLNYQTESNLLFFKTQTDYDVLFIGISHARNFSRHKNHIQVEKILNKSIINIGQGSAACGVNEQLFYLDYFYHLKNRTQKVIYMLSPPLFFSESLPKASNTFNNETFEFSFFYRYLFFNSENKKERVQSYLRSKLTKQWLETYPFSLESKTEKLDSLDTKEVQKGQDFAYGKSPSLERFRKSTIKIEETINLAITNNSDVILIIPPALFGKWPEHDKVVDFAKKMTKNKRVEFYDYSESILKPEYYYDHHHLNTKGIIFFTDNYLKPIISGK
ncbi:MAG: hypothetical protein KA215_11490 [Flavobacterium sp.]|nr:hypothetical protein [Flavobacterium sp.]